MSALVDDGTAARRAPLPGTWRAGKPFVPAPLVDLARGEGFASHGGCEDATLVQTFFVRIADGLAPA